MHPRWKEITEAGKRYAMRKFNNNKSMKDVLRLIEELS